MSCGQSNTIFVKIGKEGGRIQELCLLGGSDISSILSKVYLTVLDDEEIVVNGNSRVGQFCPHDKDVILIRKKQVKMIVVKVGKVGEVLKRVSVKDQATIAQALVDSGTRMACDEDIYLHRNGGKDGVKVVQTLSGLNEGDVIIIEKRKIPSVQDQLHYVLNEYCECDNYHADMIAAINKIIEKDYIKR
jgi:hypothetical protein